MKIMANYSSSVTKNINLSKNFKEFIKTTNKMYPFLSNEEEVELRNKLAEGSVEARDRLVYGSINYVVKCVLRNPYVKETNAEDVIMGVLAEMSDKAFSYDPKYGTKFITYMGHTIENAIWDQVSELSVNDRRFIRKYTSACEKNGFSPVGELSEEQNEILAKELQISPKTIQRTRERIDRGTYSYSMDAPISNDDGLSLEEMCHNEQSNPEEDYFEWNEYKTVSEAMNKIKNKKGKEIIELSYGMLTGSKEMSIREISELTSIGRMTVHNLKKATEKELKDILEEMDYVA